MTDLARGGLCIALLAAGALGLQPPPASPAGAAPAPSTPVPEGEKGTIQAPTSGAPKPGGSAQENDATRVLHASAEAIRRARVITYSFRQSSTGGIAEVTQEITGDMRMTRRTPPGAGATPGDPWYARVVGEGGSSRKRTTFEVVFFREPSTPEQAEWLEDADKKLLQRAVNAPGPSLMLAKQARFEPLFAEQPYSREMNGAKAELSGQEDVDGVACDVVTLTRGNNNVERWYIATSDHLPRQHVKVSNAGAYSGEIIRTLSGLTHEDLDQGNSAAEALRIKLPEGFTEDRAALPRTPTTPPPGAPGSGGGATPGPPGTSTRSTVPATAPDFEISRHGSESDRVTRDSLRGSVAVLEFFGSWNVSLDAWHPLLEGVAREFGPKGAKFLAASVRERSRDAGAEMLKGAGSPLEALVNADGASKAFGVRVFPAVAVIGKEGELLALVQGCRNEEHKLDIQNAIERGLGLPTTPRPEKAAPASDEKSASSAMLPGTPADAKRPDAKAAPSAPAKATPQAPLPSSPAPSKQAPSTKPSATPTVSPARGGVTKPGGKPVGKPARPEKPSS